MERCCVVCHVRPPQFRCIQCHKPVCDECAFKNDLGAFCSRECATNYREFYRSAPPVARRRPRTLLAVLVFLILFALLLGAFLKGWIPLPR